MKFELTPEQVAKFEKWRLNNKKKTKTKKESNNHHTFSFTSNGIGIVIIVTDDYGNRIDLTDIDNW